MKRGNEKKNFFIIIKCILRNMSRGKKTDGKYAHDAFNEQNKASQRGDTTDGDEEKDENEGWEQKKKKQEKKKRKEDERNSKRTIYKYSKKEYIYIHFFANKIVQIRSK